MRESLSVRPACLIFAAARALRTLAHREQGSRPKVALARETTGRRRHPLVRSLALLPLLAIGLAMPALAQAYPPDGPNIPVIANTEDAAGASGPCRPG